MTTIVHRSVSFCDDEPFQETHQTYALPVAVRHGNAMVRCRDMIRGTVFEFRDGIRTAAVKQHSRLMACGVSRPANNEGLSKAEVVDVGLFVSDWHHGPIRVWCRVNCVGLIDRRGREMAYWIQDLCDVSHDRCRAGGLPP